MKRTVGFLVAWSVVLITLSGCGRIVDWGVSNFNQGQDFETHTDAVKPFVRSATIYDQFTTKGNFVALWLSETVRTAYADLHMFREGKSEEKKEIFLQRQLEENNYYITFYVLSTHNEKLGEASMQWSIFLDIDNVRYYPLEIKTVELPYEYKIFFDNQYNRFKEPYIVRFVAKDSNEMPILTPDTKNIILYIRSGTGEQKFVWNPDAIEKQAISPMKPKEIKEKIQVPRKRKRK